MSDFELIPDSELKFSCLIPVYRLKLIARWKINDKNDLQHQKWNVLNTIGRISLPSAIAFFALLEIACSFESLFAAS